MGLTCPDANASYANVEIFQGFLGVGLHLIEFHSLIMFLFSILYPFKKKKSSGNMFFQFDFFVAKVMYTFIYNYTGLQMWGLFPK